MIVHICCSVDSHYFLKRLKALYPNEKLIGFFYDPNIHPYSEYRLRLIDVKRSCDMLGVELIEGDYDYLDWLEAVKGLENEPEKGKRCSVCFDTRLEKTALKAKELGEDKITTTLLMSPKKSSKQLKIAGDALKEKYGVKFIAVDFRKGGGTQEQFALAKKDKLYHQNYCGCIYALTKQRLIQERLLDELMSPISKQILPGSIEERIELYSKRVKLEQGKKEYKIIREKFLNYRLLNAFVKENKKTIPSYFIAYSTLRSTYTKGKIAYENDGVYYLNKDEIKIVALKKVNELLGSSYKSVKEMLFCPLSFEKEISLREKIIRNFYSLSTIVIIDEVKDATFEIFCKSKTYSDVRENLVIF